MRSQIQDSLRGKMILAPLTRGGNLPFRRLCADFGMDASVSEMIYARSLLRGDAVEQARIRRSINEPLFGVQIATNLIDEGVNAIDEILRLEDPSRNGAPDFIDLNCGCPIYEATRRGLGSSLLRSPTKLGTLVSGLVSQSKLPLTVKIRLGCEANTINCSHVVRELRQAGATAITIHGRTAQQGYSKDADWELITKVVEEGKKEGYGHIPIIGNGDILTYYEARRFMERSGVNSVMVGRGALIKPWIFQEFNQNRSWNPDMNERIQVYRTLTAYMKDHFGDDAMGWKKSKFFLPWHFEFFCRYKNYPEEEYGDQSMEKPLIQNRYPTEDDMSPLQILMSNRCTDAHQLIASALWESDSDMDALHKLESLAESALFKDILQNGNIKEEQDEELANLPSKGKAGKWEKRRRRNPGPKRTDEEIAKIRAERAAKKERILAAGGAWPPN